MICGKKIYRSERQAKQVRNLREKDARELRVYFCKGCPGWHLTKKFKAPRF